MTEQIYPHAARINDAPCRSGGFFIFPILLQFFFARVLRLRIKVFYGILNWLVTKTPLKNCGDLRNNVK
jgi:hypothetical protein